MQTYAWREKTPQPDREYRGSPTGRILFDFAELVSRLYGIDTSWNYAVEHSPFAGDWREEGGVK